MSVTSSMVSFHICGTHPCDICGAGYAPGVFRVEKTIAVQTFPAGPVTLADGEVERIAQRVADLLRAEWKEEHPNG